MKPDTDRTAELFRMPNGVPAPGQAFCPRNGVRGLGKSYTIGIADIKPDSTAEFLKAQDESASRDYDGKPETA